MSYRKQSIGLLTFLFSVLLFVLLSLSYQSASLQDAEPEPTNTPGELVYCPAPLTTNTITDPDCDGLLSPVDQCPNVQAFTDTGCLPVVVPTNTPGELVYCPEPLTTNKITDPDCDGLLSPVDQCPNVHATTDNGCPAPLASNLTPTIIIPNPPTIRPTRYVPPPTLIPDSDGDGIRDNKDRCPNIIGSGEDGCLYRGAGKTAVLARELNGIKHLDVFVIIANTLYYGEWENHRIQWKALPGSWVGEPVVVETAPQQIEVYVTDKNSNLYYAILTAGEWSTWTPVPNAIAYSTPTIVVRENRLDIFVVDTEGNIARTNRSGNTWADWAILNLVDQGVVAASIPNVVVVKNGALFIVVRDNTNRLWYITGDNYAWTQWNEINGGYSSVSPTIVTDNGNKVIVFAVGETGHLRQIIWDGSVWSDQWIELPSITNYPPSVVVDADNTISVFYRSQNNSSGQLELWRNVWNGSEWSQSESWEGILTGDPVAFRWSDTVGAVVIGVDNELWQRSLGSVLNPWESMGRP